MGRSPRPPADAPLIFTGESIRQLAAGDKTVTRRLLADPYAGPCLAQGPAGGRWRAEFAGGPQRARVGLPGAGRVWAREAWRLGGPGEPAVVYRADDEGDPGPWRSPMFMPRRHARLWFDVVSVRAEPLRAVTAADARAEGVRPPPGLDPGAELDALLVAGFAARWDALHARRAPWRTDPWVWRIELALLAPTAADLTRHPDLAHRPRRPTETR